METILGISLYSYPYLNWQKGHVFLIIPYVYSNKIEKKGRTGFAWKRGGVGSEEGSGGLGEEMSQTIYAHVHK
jgi:hypothetical protein